MVSHSRLAYNVPCLAWRLVTFLKLLSFRDRPNLGIPIEGNRAGLIYQSSSSPQPSSSPHSSSVQSSSWPSQLSSSLKEKGLSRDFALRPVWVSLKLLAVSGGPITSGRYLDPNDRAGRPFSLVHTPLGLSSKRMRMPMAYRLCCERPLFHRYDQSR